MDRQAEIQRLRAERDALQQEADAVAAEIAEKRAAWQVELDNLAVDQEERARKHERLTGAIEYLEALDG